jgi:hypothetical protein
MVGTIKTDCRSVKATREQAHRKGIDDPSTHRDYGDTHVY